MSVKIFYDLMSQPARTLVMFVRTNKIPYTACPIAMRKLEHKSAEYAAVNPFKKIPAMQDGDFKLTESIAIVKYLQTKYACPDHWYPSDLQTRARVDEYLAWQHMNTRINVSKVFLKQLLLIFLRNLNSRSATIAKYLHEKFDCPEHWYPKNLQQRSRVNEYLDWQLTNTRALIMKLFMEKVIFPRMTGTPADPAALAPDIQKMEETLDNLESYFLKDKPFLCGEDISIADLFGVNEVIQAVPCGYGTIDERPKLKAWIERVRQRVEPEIFDDVCQLIYKFTDMNKKPKL